MSKGKIDLSYRAHPWHGVFIGSESPEIVTTYIEMVPSDTIKYELDKDSGLLKVDRPQKFSSMPPMLYGFIPQTYCGEKIAEFCMQKTNRSNIKGDEDPLDICIMTERPITHSNLLISAIPIGGFRMIDGEEADDKIIAHMKDDPVFSQWKDIADVPEALIERLRHYFLTYKDTPGATKRQCEITHIYGKEEAYQVIIKSSEDYKNKFDFE